MSSSSTETSRILSSDAINAFIFVSNFFTVSTVLFAILSIWVIFRYANRSMKDYKFFLLNIAFCIFFSDMCFHFLCRPYLLYPVMGACMVGSIESPLINQLGIEGAMKAMSFLQVLCTVSSMSAIANATIHRYALAAKLTHPTSGFFFNKYFLGSLMVFLQFVWPLVGCLLCLRMDLRSDGAVEENMEASPLITQRTSQHACFLAPFDFRQILDTVSPTLLICLHGATCALGSMIIVLLCWHKITQAQRGTVSRKTVAMEKQLMISLGIQAFAPNLLFLVCILVIIILFLGESAWTGTIGTLAFRIGSAHTMANFFIMCYTIPAFHKGIARDIRRYILRRKTTPTTMLWGTTSSSRI